MNRREALKGILLACSAPFYIPAERLMRIKPIVVPSRVKFVPWEPDVSGLLTWYVDGVRVATQKLPYDGIVFENDLGLVISSKDKTEVYSRTNDPLTSVHTVTWSLS